MEKSFSIGLSVSWINASWPLADLSVTPACLKVSGLGSYQFSPEQVERIEYVSYFTRWNSSLRIRHLREEYPDDIRFSGVWGRNTEIIAAIVDSGFLPADKVGIRPLPPPVRLWVLPVLGLLCLLPWLARLLTDGHSGVLWPLAGMSILGLIASTALRVSAALRQQVLREGRDEGEIEVPIFIGQVASVALLFGSVLLLLATSLARQ